MQESPVAKGDLSFETSPLLVWEEVGAGGELTVMPDR